MEDLPMTEIEKFLMIEIQRVFDRKIGTIAVIGRCEDCGGRLFDGYDHWCPVLENVPGASRARRTA